MNRILAKQQTRRSVQTGFTLSELMVASMIGLFIVAGAISVFTANRQTAQTVERVQGNQEAMRYVAHTISRVVRMGRSFEGSDATKLVVVFPDESESTAKDCIGSPIDEAERNIFTSAYNKTSQKHELRCQSGDKDPIALVDGLVKGTTSQPNFSLQYFQPSNDPEKPNEVGTLTNKDITPASATTVKVELWMQPIEGGRSKEPDVHFMVTMRCKVLGCE
ncbi:PilW family protein [Thiocapsa sp.]|uniref:PilW family protein n=1 Tax=Thiocapsa sp. TaxID=2024551 RepID=UPI001BD0328B|nr:prepilin-type N-terminal cleavage/methylation domain-containing protein [Thiocapsa sp.]